MLACVVGCGGSSTPNVPPAMPVDASAPVIGDWFLCDAADCSTLKNHGVTWSTDGTWVLLEVRDAQALDPTGMYCASTFDANKGPYMFDETSGAIMMIDDLGRTAGSGTLTFAPPSVSFAQDNGVTSLYTKIDPPRLSGDCPVLP